MLSWATHMLLYIIYIIILLVIISNTFRILGFILCLTPLYVLLEYLYVVDTEFSGELPELIT